ncbi:MAG: hypothetical protein AMJ79_15600 [Phycisphaerae bacterium SM23_30]|nr:MAG: hypothetical protein AMJ79_15600 [Phycisphaerae bacterium SM23_30]
MKLLLNGQELEQMEPVPTTLGVALVTVQEKHIAGDQTIATVYIDGEPLTAERLAEWKDRPVDDFQEAHIQSLKRNILAAQGLRLVADDLGESRNQREQIVDHLCRGRSTEAMKMLNGYLQVWNTVQQTLAGAGRLLEIELDTLEVSLPAEDPDQRQIRPLADLFNHLTEQLKELKSSLEAQDLVLLGDILEYEFGPLTENWHRMLNQVADTFEKQD